MRSRSDCRCEPTPLRVLSSLANIQNVTRTSTCPHYFADSAPLYSTQASFHPSKEKVNPCPPNMLLFLAFPKKQGKERSHLRDTNAQCLGSINLKTSGRCNCNAPTASSFDDQKASKLPITQNLALVCSYYARPQQYLEGGERPKKRKQRRRKGGSDRSVCDKRKEGDRANCRAWTMLTQKKAWNRIGKGYSNQKKISKSEMQSDTHVKEFALHQSACCAWEQKKKKKEMTRPGSGARSPPLYMCSMGRRARVDLRRAAMDVSLFVKVLKADRDQRGEVVNSVRSVE
ncbi:hypothetical protein L209DRAFT_464258 [Thermothelomyces heterothallicus CBS 203.75]